MVKIFISYRRDDSADVTDSVFLQLNQHFGEGNVFLDVGSIPFGVDFRDYLNEQIQAHDVVLVMIGRDWGRIMQERASQSNDFVRIEIESALQQDKLVIPVLVRGANMPNFSELPESIRDLQWRNSATIRRLPDLIGDCERLADGIKAWAVQNKAKTKDDVKSVSSVEKKSNHVESGRVPTVTPNTSPPVQKDPSVGTRQNENIMPRVSSKNVTKQPSTSPNNVLNISYGSSSDAGMVRMNNQDRYGYEIKDRSVLFVVADGMGGHDEGELAAQTAVDSMLGGYKGWVAFHKARHPDALSEQTLSDWVKYANEQVIKKAPEGGATLTACIVTSKYLWVAHVGNTRAYRIVDGKIEQLTRDHSLVQRLYELEQITLDEMKEHPQKNVLYRALGANDSVEVDVKQYASQPKY
jgi:hypothetical protein